MLICKFCLKKEENNSWFNNLNELCVDCKDILDLSKIYTIEQLKKTLFSVYVRDEVPVLNRTKAIKEQTEMVTRSKKKVTYSEATKKN